MKNKKEILDRLKKGALLLDGAMGTELQKQGLPGGVSPELWALEHPQVLSAIQRSYREAGSQGVYTCTFGANPVKLGDYHREDVEGVNRDLARISRQALGETILLGGDISSTGRFVEPFGDLPFEEAAALFRRQARGLWEGGVDFFVIETQIDIQEARAALLGVKEIGDPFTLVTMTFEKDGRTLNGTTPEAALITLQSLGADAVGINCSTGPEEMLALIRRMAPLARVPLAAKPNAGMPRLEGGRTVFPMGPEEFGRFAPEFIRAGVSLFGGCCGTTPEHIRRARENLQSAGSWGSGEAAFLRKDRPKVFALSSAREALVSLPGSPLTIIGERINPTGKKALQEELKAGKTALVSRMAREQRDAGAGMLDINAGMPGINEGETLLRIIRVLSASSSLPLCVDSDNPETVEQAIRLYPGRALVNSLSGEPGKLERLLPALAKYGSAFILLPLTPGGIPETAPERMAVVREIFNRAQGLGYREEDILVDGLVMTVSSLPNAPVQTLETLKLAREAGFGAVLGLSNVSFGLPAREWINGAFLAMACAAGLSFAIANPAGEILGPVKAASDLLLGRDPRGGAFLKRFAGLPAKAPEASGLGASGGGDPEGGITEAILNGEKESLLQELGRALEGGRKPRDLLEGIMIPAILRVGDLFDQKKFFLPQLMGSAEAMQEGFAFLEPLLKSPEPGDGESPSLRRPPKVVLATVEGDIHDIGKNIVALLFRNYGFQVIDLGKDVPGERIAEAALKHRPDLVGLSALMTTTMPRIPETAARLKSLGLGAPVLAGGAAVTREWAESFGAYYAADGIQAVRRAQELLAAAGKTEEGPAS
ncbi:MAG: homocysteine S-methyltransferase family protein [Spirochaetales bacterium]|jgi:5-methyltetrahydrofolate--homocysteine methyltransferase|nr:homocysteine S-methyltransferase family protein [Spirochaetales bacterium]